MLFEFFNYYLLMETIESSVDTERFIIMLLPGMGCCNIEKDLWYGWLHNELQIIFPTSILLFKNMPDPLRCRQSLWIPFINTEIEKAKIKYQINKVYLIGHSTGAVALMRYIETHKIAGAAICSGYISDLGDEKEKESEYFPSIVDDNVLNEWKWSKMVENTNWIINIGSEDDKYVPFSEIKEVSIQLGLNEANSLFFLKSEGKGHFLMKTFPELLKILTDRINQDQSI